MDTMTSYMAVNYGAAKPAAQVTGIPSTDSPDTPFGLNIDCSSDFGDDETYGSFVVGDIEHSLSHTHLADDDMACEGFIEFWESAWYGGLYLLALSMICNNGWSSFRYGCPSRAVHRSDSHAKSMTHTAEQLSSHHYASSSVPSLPGSPRGFYYENPSPSMSHSLPGYPAEYSSQSEDTSRCVQATNVSSDPKLMPSESYSSQTSTGLTFGLHLTGHSCDDQASDDGSTGNSWKERKFELPPAETASTSAKRPLSTTLPAPVPGASAAVTVRRQLVTASSEDDDEAAMAAAWKWRFCRRWKAEQVRAFDPKRASGDGDTMADALAYLNAVGDGYCGNQGRRISSELAEPDGVKNSGSTYGTSSLLGGEMFTDDSFSLTKQNLLASAVKRERSTKEVAGMAKRAHQLLEQQQEVSRRADERWKGELNSSGIARWAGDFIEPVAIDDWGKYRFVLIRIKDKDRQKVLVRGRNYCTEEALISEAKAQVAQSIEQHHLSKVTLEIQGAGVMEWRRDRDRHLEVHTPIVYHCPGSTMQPREFNRLVGVLAKQHLPIHYRVTADGCAL